MIVPAPDITGELRNFKGARIDLVRGDHVAVHQHVHGGWYRGRTSEGRKRERHQIGTRAEVGADLYTLRWTGRFQPNPLVMKSQRLSRRIELTSVNE